MTDFSPYVLKTTGIKVDEFDEIEILNKDRGTIVYGKLFNTNALLKGLGFKWNNENKCWYIDKKITRDEFKLYFDEYNNNRRNINKKNNKKCEICNKIGHTFKNCENSSKKEILVKEIKELEKILKDKKALLKKMEN